MAGASWVFVLDGVTKRADVEVAFIPGMAGVRDSKHVETSPVLPFAASEWTGFIARIKRGELG
jgi:hypothetical protein